MVYSFLVFMKRKILCTHLIIQINTEFTVINSHKSIDGRNIMVILKLKNKRYVSLAHMHLIMNKIASIFLNDYFHGLTNLIVIPME